MDRRVVALLLIALLTAPFAAFAGPPGTGLDVTATVDTMVTDEGAPILDLVNETNEFASALEHVANVENGQDIRGSRIVDGILYAVGHSGFYIYDLTDPENPVRLFFEFCPGRDIAVSGDFAAIIREGGSCSGSGKGVVLYNVSTPSSAFMVRPFSMPAHTIANIGDTGIFHVASQVLTPYTEAGLTNARSGQQEIIDTRSGVPVQAPTFVFPRIAENGDPVNAPSCHEFYYEESLDRGYCAGVVETHIWDMTDPLNPKVMSVIKNPNISIHHSARPTADGGLVIINDEEGGALVPACYTGTEGRAPRGALWFYDTGRLAGSDERPLLISWVSIPTPISRGVALRCTSHYGEVLPNDQQAVWSWYGAGMVLIDFTNPLLPTVKSSFLQTTRDSWGANLDGTGYAATGDMQRGIDVYRLVEA